MIKDQMDKKFGSPWHVVVGRGFAYEITYEVGSRPLVTYAGGAGTQTTGSSCLQPPAAARALRGLRLPRGFWGHAHSPPHTCTSLPAAAEHFVLVRWRQHWRAAVEDVAELWPEGRALEALAGPPV